MSDEEYTLFHLAQDAIAGDPYARGGLEALRDAALEGHPDAIAALESIPGLWELSHELAADALIENAVAAAEPEPPAPPPISEPTNEPAPRSIGEAVEQFFDESRQIKRAVYGSEMQNEPTPAPVAEPAEEFTGSLGDAIHELMDELHIEQFADSLGIGS